MNVGYCKLFAAFLCRSHHSIALSDGVSHRLLNEDVNSAFEEEYGRRQMKSVRKVKYNRINFNRAGDILIVKEIGNVKLLRQLLDLRLVEVAKSYKLALGELLEGIYVLGGN